MKKVKHREVIKITQLADGRSRIQIQTAWPQHLLSNHHTEPPSRSSVCTLEEFCGSMLPRLTLQHSGSGLGPALLAGSALHTAEPHSGSFASVLCACSVVSSSLWPCGLQPTELLCPWDSPGKNTIRGCHFLLQGLPDPGIKPISSASPTLAGRLSLVPPGKINFHFHLCLTLWQKNPKPLSWFTCPESLSPELGPLTALHRDKKASSSAQANRPSGTDHLAI